MLTVVITKMVNICNSYKLHFSGWAERYAKPSLYLAKHLSIHA
jgi:hypothetical protein